MTSFLPCLSSRVQDLHASPIREILAVAGRPGVISFAGGLPAPESFPAVDLGDLPRDCMQYGASEGDMPLRRQIAEEVSGIGLPCCAEQVLVLSGSQQGIDLVAKLFVDAGTLVAVESPTYLAALQVFRFFGARFVDLADVNAGRRAEPPALAYVIPTFQNPTGRCYTAPERLQLAASCDAAGVILFEDDPYRDLAYDPCDRTPVCAALKRTSWIYQGSFSKTLAPGLRLGFMVASQDLVPHLTRLKQAADLHSNRLAQWFVLRHLLDPDRRHRQSRLAALYRTKRDVFSRLLQRHFSGLATWNEPAGGLFFWLSLNAPIDSERLLPPALAEGVAFMPGTPFFANRSTASSAIRLNFSLASEEEAARGLQVLARLIRAA